MLLHGSRRGPRRRDTSDELRQSQSPFCYATCKRCRHILIVIRDHIVTDLSHVHVHVLGFRSRRAQPSPRPSTRSKRWSKRWCGRARFRILEHSRDLVGSHTSSAQTIAIFSNVPETTCSQARPEDNKKRQLFVNSIVHSQRYRRRSVRPLRVSFLEKDPIRSRVRSIVAVTSRFYPEQPCRS